MIKAGGSIDEWADDLKILLDPLNSDLAFQLYHELRTLSKATAPLDRLKKGVYLVEFHHLRVEFAEKFLTDGRADPLAEYLIPRVGNELSIVRNNCTRWGSKGRRIDEFAVKTGHPGMPLLQEGTSLSS